MSELETRASGPAQSAPVLPEFVERARDVVSVRRVYGEPVEQDGAIVVPAATVFGGGGGGTGIDTDGREGNGGGFGVYARPAGALIIRDGDVRWEPAVNPERRVIAAAVVATVGMLAFRSVVRSALRRRRRRHH